MARKTIDNNLFSKTETKEKAPVKKYPSSVYLPAEEKEKLAGIAKDLGESVHALMQFAIKDFLRRYDAGEFEIHTEKITKKSLISK